MNFNLFIYYQMKTINESAVINAIQKLGNVTRLGNGFWFVNSSVNAQEAIKRVSSWITDKDQALIIDAANNEIVWFNIDDQTAQRIRQNWHMPLGTSSENSAEKPSETPNKENTDITTH